MGASVVEVEGRDSLGLTELSPEGALVLGAGVGVA